MPPDIATRKTLTLADYKRRTGHRLTKCLQLRPLRVAAFDCTEIDADGGVIEKTLANGLLPEFQQPIATVCVAMSLNKPFLKEKVGPAIY